MGAAAVAAVTTAAAAATTAGPTMVESGTLVRLSDDVVYLSETYEEMKARVVAQIRETGSLTIAQVRDLFGASRKYALALMEYLDEQRVTRRRGDTRVLR